MKCIKEHQSDTSLCFLVRFIPFNYFLLFSLALSSPSTPRHDPSLCRLLRSLPCSALSSLLGRRVPVRIPTVSLGAYFPSS